METIQPQTSTSLDISKLYIKSVYADKFDEQYGLRLNNSQEPKNSYKIIIEIGIEKTGLFSKQTGGKLIIVWGPEKKFFDLLNIVSFNINGKSLNDYKVTSRIDVLGKLWGELKGGKVVGDVNVSCGQNQINPVPKKDLLLYFILNLVKTCSITNSSPPNSTLNKRMKYLKIDETEIKDTSVLQKIFFEPFNDFNEGIKMFNRSENSITFKKNKINKLKNSNKGQNEERKKKIRNIEYSMARGTPVQTLGGQGNGQGQAGGSRRRRRTTRSRSRSRTTKKRTTKRKTTKKRTTKKRKTTKKTTKK